jgi:hypothetical protein
MGIHNRNKQYGFASVKPRDAEVIKNRNINNKKLFTIGGSILIIALLVWGVSAFVKSDMDTKVKNGFVELFKNEDKLNIETTFQPDYVVGDVESKPNNTASVVLGSNFSSKETVKLALLASPNLFDYKNHPVLGCDALVFAKTEIDKTPKVLNSTLNLLFNDGFDYGFPPANFISSTQKDLKFESAVIENGVAKVFLSGKITIQNTSCDEDRVIYQITETAKQFSTVKSVDIFLNGKKLEL